MPTHPKPQAANAFSLLGLALWLLSLFAVAPAWAGTVVFPGEGAVGLEPPGAMTKADSFAGFQDSEEGASILIAEFPREAYAEIAPQFNAETLSARMAVTGPVQKLTLASDVEALLATGTQTQQGIAYRKWVMIAQGAEVTAMITVQLPVTSEAYTDAQIRDTLNSVRFQPRGSLEDEISRLPFTVAERADFRAVRTLAGSGLILTDGPKDVVTDASQPLVIIASSLGSNPSVGALSEDERMQLALNAMKTLTLKDVQVESTDVEPDGDVLIAGKGIDQEEREMSLRQIMRFGPAGHVRTVCMFTAEQDIAERCDRVGQAVTLKVRGAGMKAEE
ncbi:hypothetical protein GCM10009096_30120 [Parasphingorhabdus litoris]|uniref:Uncharacterized protein n=2 Tax=Parasphingorhabdus litoris TaxID=394733 RepID=A0ABP3KQZ5_9SPHN